MEEEEGAQNDKRGFEEAHKL
ncbi:uncharacterized protein G2W53_003467 [Senna tora]|uniref:Uncharacterized protein n=1 Tax=Senna tora TaxID=362788 RepID=A0A835CGE9_9FABA|nr:uncharacterized protein G2W53_003467 [Senna tora]